MGSRILTMSPPASPSIGLAKMPKFYYQAEDFEVNFVPHFILPLFLLEVINSIAETLNEIGDGNGNISDSAGERSTQVKEYESATSTYGYDSELYKKRLLQRVLEIESELMKIRGNVEEGR